MEFEFSVSRLFGVDSPGEAIICIDGDTLRKYPYFQLFENGQIINPGNSMSFQQQRLAQMADNVRSVIEAVGSASAKAQGLRAPVTTVLKLLSQGDHRLYMKVEDSRVIGLLKTGLKKLFVATRNDGMKELEPVCVLDFYVHETCQRKGHGRMLLDYVIKVEGVERPEQLAFDRPSPKFLSFLRKHYGLAEFTPQPNNFVVFDKYLSQIGSSDRRRRSNTAPKSNRVRPPASVDVAKAKLLIMSAYKESERSKHQLESRDNIDITHTSQLKDCRAAPEPVRSSSGHLQSSVGSPLYSKLYSANQGASLFANGLTLEPDSLASSVGSLREKELRDPLRPDPGTRESAGTLIHMRADPWKMRNEENLLQPKEERHRNPSEAAVHLGSVAALASGLSLQPKPNSVRERPFPSSVSSGLTSKSLISPLTPMYPKAEHTPLGSTSASVSPKPEKQASGGRGLAGPSRVDELHEAELKRLGRSIEEAREKLEKNGAYSRLEGNVSSVVLSRPF